MSRLKGSLWGFSDLASIIPKVFMPTLKDFVLTKMLNSRDFLEVGKNNYLKSYTM